MKRKYNSPQMQWVPIRSNRAVADVCWAHAKNVKPFYYNTYGTGYAELYALGNKCDREVTIAQVVAEMPQKPTNYKGSPFVDNVNPEWS